MSFSERRYDFQRAGDPIFGIQPISRVGPKLQCPSSQISAHDVANGIIIGISPFRKKHDRPAAKRSQLLRKVYHDSDGIVSYSCSIIRVYRSITMAIALALLSSLLISGTTIIMKKGIERTNPTSAMLVVTLVGSLILLGLSLPQVQFDHLRSKAFPLFILAGILSPALVRWLYFISLDRIGPSMSSSILSTGPAVTAIIAAIFLKEELTVSIGLGIMLIIAGIITFERDINTDGKFGVRHKQDLLFAVLAAFLVGLAIVIRKMGLNVLNEPLFGVTVGFITSLLFYAILCLIFKRMRAAISLNRQNTLYLCGAGAFLTAGWLSLFYALSHGDAIIVAPLANLHPVMVLGWSYLLFKDMEKITIKTVWGIVLVLIGVLLITLR